MEDGDAVDTLSPGQLPLRLFERLTQGSQGYTWDRSFTPFHTSYDHWHVYGIRHVQQDFEPMQATPSATTGTSARSSSSRSSPKLDPRPAFRHQWSSISEADSEISNSRLDPEQIWTPVIARISTHVVRLEREYNHNKSIIKQWDPESKHTVRPVQMFRLPPTPGDSRSMAVTVYESPGPNYLREVIDLGPANSFTKRRKGSSEAILNEQVAVQLWLDFAIGACECLELLHHGAKAIHGELRADAFHWNHETGIVKLVNGGNGPRAFENLLSSEGWATMSREIGVKNRLSFMAPEQTGRLAAEPDSRTDIYSLGVLFWVLLTGKSAFEADTPIDIVSKVLSQRLPLASSIRMDVPDVISHIIAKMTVKQMDERYHSINGLKYDLLQVQKMLGEGEQEKLRDYTIGQKDVSAFFILPSKTFGRSVERERIFKVIERVHKRQTSATEKMLAHALYTTTSNSSLSESRLDPIEVADGSDSSSSHGVKDSRSNSTTVGVDTFPTPKFSLLGLQGKAITEPRSNSLDLADQESQMSTGLSANHREGMTTFSRRRNSHKFKKRGKCEVVTLVGAQGVGKTHLIKSVQPHIRRHGYFALARFDRMKPIPFEPLLRVMASLFRQIFSEKDVNTSYHEMIRTHVRPIWSTLHAILDLPESLLDDKLPSDRTLAGPAGDRSTSADASSIGGTSTISGLTSNAQRSETDFLRGPASTKSIRLINTYLDVLRTMSSEKLICICLDDIHAADEESAELVMNIIKAKTPVVLLLSSRSGDDIPAYTNKILDVEGVHQIELGALREKHVFEYVAATLFRDPQDVVPLAAVVHAKSGGNPFLMKEILHTCYEKECLWYDWKASGWQFDIDKVFTEFTSEEGCLDTSFVTRRLQELPPASRSILAWASLIGNSFSFNLILRLVSGEHLYSSKDDHNTDVTCPKRAVLFNLSESDCVDGLQTLLNTYVLVPGESDDEFRFAHTRYLRAANLMRECHNTTKMHAIIAFTMMDHLSHCRRNMYPLARHICLAAEVIKERVPLRIRYRDVLWRAAQTAATTGAKPTALWYYKVCLELLQDDRWNADAKDVFYDETLQLYVAAAELYYMQGEHDDAIRLLDETFAHCRSAADRSRPWLLKGRIKTKRNDFEGALNALTTCLAELGVALPPTTWDECDIEFKKLEFRLRQIDRAELMSRPLSEHQTVIARGTVSSEATSAAYWANSLLWYQLVLKTVNVNLDQGSTVQIGINFLSMAMIAIGRFKDVELGMMFGSLAQEFLTLYDDIWTRGRGWTMYALFVGHFQTPLTNHLPILESALDYSYSSGDRAVCILNIGAMAMYRLWSGQDLADLEAFCTYGPEEFEAWDHDLRGGTLLMAVRQLARALQGKTQTGFVETILDDEGFKTADWISATVKRAASTTFTQASSRAQDLYHAITIQAYYHYGYYKEAADMGRRLISTSLDDLWTNRGVAGVRYYTALSLLALAREQPDEYDVLAETTALKHFIDVWGSVDDVNYLAWSHILNAGIANLKQDYHTVGQYLEMAIDHAQVHGFQIEEATAIELQADFLLDRGVKRAGKVMVQEAIAAWSRINAIGKAMQLSDKHEWLLKTAITARTMDTGTQTDQITSITTAVDATEQHRQDYTSSWVDPKAPLPPQSSQDVPGLGLDILDLTAILEFSRVISSELQIDSLLSKMTSVILESVGGQAEFCAVVIDSEDGWRVAASGDHEKGVQTYPDGIPFAEVDDQVAQHITTYLIRTRETVFVHNVLEDERFSNVSEAYLARNPKGRSIIAIPIILNEHLMGVIHLEGRPNAFTQRNMVVLNLLTNQVAISLGNALLYRKVRKVSASNASMVESQKRALAAARESEVKAKKAEERALHSVKLQEEAAKAKSIFLANVSHELRTPLNGVIGMAELLKGTPLSKDQEGYADSIRVCADTLLTVINDILDFSKLEAGKMQLFTVPLNLKETITEVVRALAYTNQEHGLETIEDLQLDDNLVLGDPVRLHQVFMNLLSNSYKFTPKGSVTVKARKISETKDKLRITCAVSDTGIGITREQLTRLFQPFSQADSSTARSYGGSGLGLSICKAMIENVLGGKIWIESEPGVGTTVSFTLTFAKAPKDSKVPTANDMSMSISAKDPDPMANWSQGRIQNESQGQSQSQGPNTARLAAEKPSKPSSSCDVSKIAHSDLRICIAEDNPINRKIAISFCRKLLPHCGCVDAYEDGQLALTAIQKASQKGQPYHIVLMDVQMPNLDGYEATKLIRKDADESVKGVLVIAMTASAIRGDREKCLQAGMNDYLAKPVRQAALKGMLDNYLSNATDDTVAMHPANSVNGTTSDKENDGDKENGSINRTSSTDKEDQDKDMNKENKRINGTTTRDDKDDERINGHANGSTNGTDGDHGNDGDDVPSGKRETDILGRVSTDQLPAPSQMGT